MGSATGGMQATGTRLAQTAFLFRHHDVAAASTGARTAQAALEWAIVADVVQFPAQLCVGKRMGTVIGQMTKVGATPTACQHEECWQCPDC